MTERCEAIYVLRTWIEKPAWMTC